MQSVTFEAVPINLKSLPITLPMTSQNMQKYEELDKNTKNKLISAFTRGILLECVSKNRVFKVEPFRKTLMENLNLSVPPGCLIPLLLKVNNTLNETFGYQIAPINYMKKGISFVDNGQVKEIILINLLSSNLVRQTNSWRENKESMGKLFWTICFLYLCNGCEASRLQTQLRTITGDSSTKVALLLQNWTSQRFINLIKVSNGERELSKYEVGMRAFVEIGYENITKFSTFVMGTEYSEEVAKKWLQDFIGKEEENQQGEKKEKTQKKGRKAKEAVLESTDYTQFLEEDDDLFVCWIKVDQNIISKNKNN